MIQTIRKAWGVPELRKKIVFTLLILLIFRIGNAIPVPYINTTLLGNYLDSMSGTVLGLYNVMSGGAFAEATVFALGVQPYINSSIIIQLLTIAIPALERLARDGGEAGKKKIASITRYATVAIALLQGFGYYMICKNYNILEQQGIWPALVIIVSFVAGSSFVMWLGEQVNEFGVGNGISIILFAGILSRVPNMVTMGASYIRTKGSIGYLWIALLIVGMLGRAPHPRPVRQASGRPQDVRRPGIHPSHEGEHVRRSAHHLRADHRVPARHHLGFHRYSRGGHRWPQHLQRDRHQVCAVSDRLLPDDHRLQLFLRYHSV